MSHDRVIGLETEYGFTPRNRRSGHPGLDDALELLVKFTAKQGASMRSLCSSGLFVGNGGQFLVDAGSHPEWSTPETFDPIDTVRYALAGDRMIVAACLELSEDSPELGVALFKGNVDYQAPGVTWACHENYGHRSVSPDIGLDLIPHFVSRPILSGAGGLATNFPGILFQLSPRATHLNRVLSASSTRDRGILHEKSEPLAAGGWNRMHVLCGESNRSHVSGWLKLATTALILRSIEIGAHPGRAVALRDPLQALHRINSDPSLRVKVALADDRFLTALDIQRHYLAEVEKCLGHDLMPPWAEHAVDRWRDWLRRLGGDGGADSAATALDWAIKLALFRRHIEQRGFDGAMIRRCNKAACEFMDWKRKGLRFLKASVACQDLLDTAEAPDKPGNDSSEIMIRFHALRAELGEIDLRYGQLFESDLFTELEHAGLLDHRLDALSDASIARASREPPEFGRARVRGEVVRMAGGARSKCRAGWDQVRSADGRLLVLTDPLINSIPEWTAVPPVRIATRPVRVSEDRDEHQLLARVRENFHSGRYASVYSWVRPWRQPSRLPRNECEFILERYGFFSSVRCGFTDEARRIGERLQSIRRDPDTLIDWMAFCRLGRLVPDCDEMNRWTLEFAGACERRESGFRPESTGYVDHRGAMLMRAGRGDEARSILRTGAERIANWADVRDKLDARLLMDLAEAERICGNPSEALAPLEAAESAQRRCRYHGELADGSLLIRAKLAGDYESAKPFLQEAADICAETRDEVGRVRVMLIDARLAGLNRANLYQLNQVRRLVEPIPSLRDCSVLGNITRHWWRWVADVPMPGATDRFCGL